jgi:peptidoglycan hydrolase CwlO-like protein
MRTSLRKKSLTVLLAAFFIATPFLRAHAQTMPVLPSADDEKAQLEAQLTQVEKQISDYQAQLTKIGSEKKTLANAIAQLKIQEATLTLKAQATAIAADKVQNDLDDTQATIDANDMKIALLRSQMSVLLRQIAQQKNLTFAEMIVSSKSIADFFQQLYALEKMTNDVGSLADQVKSLNADLAQKTAQLSDEHEQQLQLAAILVLQNDGILTSISSQDSLLVKTRGEEINYQASLSDSKKQATEIRNRIYTLLEVGQQITFSQAVQVATWASGVTGVRASFLLAILTQESNLGKNVGTCNRKGDPPSKSWKVVMKPDRDQQPFIAITDALVRDPDVTPVSCPMHDASGNQIGWGGAMGPAQFIPSTWVGYEKSVTAITGKAADPWDIRDAFIAAAIKLKDDGAGTQSGEWAAAMRYFSGSTNPQFSFYGDNVVATAAQYQKDIATMND